MGVRKILALRSHPEFIWNPTIAEDHLVKID